VNIEALLIASGQNIKRLLGKRDWPGHPGPGGMVALVQSLPFGG